MSSDNDLGAIQRLVFVLQRMADEVAAGGGDWRTQLRAVCKDRVVNKIMDAYKSNLPFSCGQEEKLKDLIVNLEEKIYAGATSQLDYLRQISSNFWAVDKGANSLDLDSQAQAQAQVQILVQGIAAEASVESGDWRAQLTADSRDKMVNIIVDTLRSGIPFFGQEGLHKLKRLAVCAEEKIYVGASNHTDYAMKVYLRIKAIGRNMHKRMGNPMQPNGASDSTNYVDQAVAEGGGWRTQLSVVCRGRIVNKIMDECKSHLPFSFGQEEKLKDLVVNFEEKIYAGATSQSDYLRHISSNFWAMDTNSPDTIGANSLDPGILRVVMDSNYWREAQAQAQAQVHLLVQGMAAEASAEGGDWRAQLTSDSRDTIVNKIVDTLSNGIPFSGKEGLHKLKRLAVCIEKKIYAGASNETDYAMKSYLRIKAIGRNMQKPICNPMQPNGASVSTNEANNNTEDELSSPNEKDLEENLVYKRGKRARKSCAKFDDFVMG